MAATVQAAVAPPLARCTVLDHRGEPLPVDQFARFHACDLLMRPFTINPQLEPGTATFPVPERPFRITLPLTVPGFGQVFVYADNRGRGLTAQSFSEKPMLLNYEFAADRLATVQSLLEDCRRGGIAVSETAQKRVEKADAFFKQAEAVADDRRAHIAALMSSLCESLWAGEMLTVERADHAIAGNGPRPGFLFGSNAFGYPELGKKYAEQFEAAFNFATLPFYRGGVERVQGKPDYSAPAKILDWLGHTNILAKGHPLIFLVPDSTPDWLSNLPYQETKKLCLQHVREAIGRFRDRIHVWDVINEAHVQPDNYPTPDRHFMKGFSHAENVDMTIGALQAAHEADPTCFRIVNSTGTWSDYYMAHHPAAWQQGVYDYLSALREAGSPFEAVGLQYYHSGRDMLEFERNLEIFKTFGKPIHISETQISSSSEDPTGKNEWWGGGIGGSKFVWHGEHFSEESQAQWVEWFYKIAFSKPYVDAVTWWDFADPAFIPNAGYLRPDLTPKPAYEKLLALQTQWREAGLLPPVTKRAVKQPAGGDG